MASLNLSSNGPSISKSYQAVVDSPLATGPSRSSTYGQWAVFSVSTPLVNAFQPDAGSKESILKVQATGEGELTDLIDEFSEGKIQFAFVKVTDPNTGLPKNVLLAWCGEGVPERTKGYFTSHLSAVSKFLHGYHVQITARSDGDLTPEGIIQKVRDASGSKYTSGAEAPVVAAPKPSVASKPVFTPTRTGGIGSTPVAAIPSRTDDNDRWGPDAPPVTRTELEKVQSAYKPTKVNMEELKTKKQPTTLVSADLPAKDNGDIVRGGYQPIGRVDIAAIRRQAKSAGELKDDRPEPVRGAYEPVGKVDIAAIRSRLQKPTDLTTVDGNSSVPSATTKSDEKAKLPGLPPMPGHSERLTTLPKPRVSNKFGVSPAFTGTKPPLPTDTASKSIATGHIGGASRTFADAGGKTPAQQWAERKAKERDQGPAPILSTPSGTEVANQSQHDATAEWKSSYSGKTWAPVQTTHTGKSVDSSVLQHAEDESPEAESLPAQQSISAIREQFASGPSTDVSLSEKPTDTDRTIPLPGLENKPTESETSYGPEAHQPVPSPPHQPRSPTPPTPPPVREASPIRVAIPVRREVTDAHDEQHSPPPVMPIRSLQQAVPDDADLEDNTHEVGGATADTTIAEPAHGGGIIALVQFDHEKAEDNEVELREGEYVTDIEMVHEDWWLGSNARGERGYFPSNYVEVIEEDQPNRLMPDTRISGPETDAPGLPVDNITDKQDPTHQSQALSKEPSATAIYDYEAAGDDELSFPEGAEIVNIEFPDDDWWFGEYQGKRGLFPANYVQLDK